jgi:hypothetical protein
MVIEHGSDAMEHPLTLALAAQAGHWPRPETGLGAPGPDWPTLRQVYADTALLDRMLASQARFTPDLDRKGQAAYLMTSHGVALGTIAAACLVGAGLVPCLGPDALGLQVVIPVADDPEERTRIRLLSSRFATDRADLAANADADPIAGRAALHERLRLELEAHLEPVVACLQAATGLSTGALWRLAGDSVAAQFLDAGRRFGHEADAIAAALCVLKAPGSPLANKEMHYFKILLPDPKCPGRTLLTRTFRARGGCCRWYTSKQGKLCTTCVLRSDADRRVVIEDNLRRRLGLPPRTASAAS